MEQDPRFWKTSLKSIEDALNAVVMGKTRVLGFSAGNREIYSVEYGEKQDMRKTANYCSAVAAGSANYYANKDQEGIKPVILLVGAEHGGEMEGIAGILNLISILETGEDLRGTRWDYIHNNWKKFRLILIPCINPDGRNRVPFDSMVGKSLETMRYYMQGTWKDGSLCGWPRCKTVHPIIDHVDFLGAYFNDDGVNLAADNVFSPMAAETKILLELVDREAPDFTVHLHGGDNCINMLLSPEYIPANIRNRVQTFDQMLNKQCREKGLRYYAFDKTGQDLITKPLPFNLNSAISHICGGISLTYESNMALNYPEMPVYSYDEILDCHLTLFEEILRFLDKGL